MTGFTEILPNARPTGAFLVIAFLFVVLEYAYSRLADHDDTGTYNLRETAASFGVAVGDVVTRLAMGSITAVPFFFLYQHRLFDIALDRPASWFGLFIGVEFLYYWFHRASHRVRWLWATHAVHHSAPAFNLSAAVRLGWTGQLSGAFVFFLPLALIGFNPFAIVTVIGLGLLYQFFLHTTLPVHLGPLEWVLNSPRHHRIHHASNDSCLDKNYGSVLIIFDRLFGTFAGAPCNEPLRFGLKGRTAGLNPFAIAFGEWIVLWQDFSRARAVRERLKILFGPP